MVCEDMIIPYPVHLYMLSLFVRLRCFAFAFICMAQPAELPIDGSVARVPAAYCTCVGLQPDAANMNGCLVMCVCYAVLCCFVVLECLSLVTTIQQTHVCKGWHCVSQPVVFTYITLHV